VRPAVKVAGSGDEIAHLPNCARSNSRASYIYDETKEKKVVANKLIELIFSDDSTRTPSKMDGERSIIRNCVIIITLIVPCVAIAVVTELICVVKVIVRGGCTLTFSASWICSIKLTKLIRHLCGMKGAHL